MQENELRYYEKIGNWDFSQIKYQTESLIDWDLYEKIKENTNEKSLCLDLGTGGGERVKFTKMNNLEMIFPKETFDLISARNTIINAKQIYDCLVPGGTVVIRGVDQKDCWELKEVFGRGQAYQDEMPISQKDYLDLKEAGFKIVEKVEILQNEYYETEEDLLALLLKTPILDDFSEIKKQGFEHKELIEKDLFDEYVKKYKTERGILLKRVYYGIVGEK